MKTYNLKSQKAKNPYGVKTQQEQSELQRMALNDLFANSEYSELVGKVKRLEEKLQEIEAERDAAIGEVAELKSECTELNEELAQYKNIEHEQLVADVFTEIAQRYLKCTTNKTEQQRKVVKDNLRDMMWGLNLIGRIPAEIKTCIDNFDDKDAPTIPQINFYGDVVMEKNVGHQVGYVSEGGTGVNINGKENEK